MESPEQEIDRLRAEVESHRQREIEELKSQLAVARAEAEQYRIEANAMRQEAMRNASLGHQINAESQRIITDLRTQLLVRQNVLSKK